MTDRMFHIRMSSHVEESDQISKFQETVACGVGLSQQEPCLTRDPLSCIDG